MQNSELLANFVNILYLYANQTNGDKGQNMIQGNLNLPELATRYNISDIYGASIAYFSSEESGKRDLRAYTDTICCYELHLIRKGKATVIISDREFHLSSGSLILLTPYHPVKCHFSNNVVSDGLLIDSTIYDSILAAFLPPTDRQPELSVPYNKIYQLDKIKTKELSNIFRQIRLTIQSPHAYKMEILQSFIHIIQVFISEFPLNVGNITHDLKHKENICKIFLYLAGRHFRTNRQVGFYATQLNITPTYMNRVIREVSGNTVSEHLTRLTFHEACNLLKSSDMTIGEIAEHLGFRDMSAFTNFFKLHAGSSPTGYRNA